MLIVSDGSGTICRMIEVSEAIERAALRYLEGDLKGADKDELIELLKTNLKMYEVFWKLSLDI